MQESYIPHGNTDASGIEQDTPMPPEISADVEAMVPCAICQWPSPEATHDVPFCEECIKHVTRVNP